MKVGSVVTGDMTLYAHWEEIKPEWEFDVEVDTAIITGYSVLLSGDVEIPASVTVEEDDGEGNVTEVSHLVTVIGDYALAGMEITSVTIPASVTNIQDWAFEDCYELTNVVFEGGMDGIAMRVVYAFSGTPWLEAYLASQPKPSNDDFDDATTISGESGGVTGTNIGAGIEEDEPLASYADSAATVWWRWTAPKSGSFVFDTHGSNFDTTLGIYTGSAIDALDIVDENDDDIDATSAVIFNAVSGTTYRVAVGGYRTDVGDIVLNWGPSLDDEDVRVDAGENSVTENGDGTYTVTPPVGGELTAADVDAITVTAKVDGGGWADTTVGYNIVLGGGVITVSLKSPEVNGMVDVALKDADDKSGFLVDPNEVTVVAEPTPDTTQGETLGALPVKAVPGLWYQASWGDSLESMTMGDKVQATVSDLYLGVIKQTGSSGFYKVSVYDRQ